MLASGVGRLRYSNINCTSNATWEDEFVEWFGNQPAYTMLCGMLDRKSPTVAYIGYQGSKGYGMFFLLSYGSHNVQRLCVFSGGKATF